MMDYAQVASEEITKTNRIIDSFTQSKEGPHVVFLGGVHGNEPSGVQALEIVLDQLKQWEGDFKGKITGLRGNLVALKAGQRYIDKDLNRIWSTPLTRIKSVEPTANEWKEKKGLIREFSEIIDGIHTPVFVDLHTTSAEGSPFMAIGDTLRNRRLTRGIPTPVILGFEEHMKGTLFNFFNYLGICSMLFEGGQHDSEEAIQNHVAFIWMALINTGCIRKEDLADYDMHFQTLFEAARGKSRIFETVFRYKVEQRELFQMDAGYCNFQPVQKNQGIATYDTERVKVPVRGKIFMPLYQTKGDDGFFIIREVSRFWILLSGFLRKLRLEKLLEYLPGVYPHQSLEDTFVINPKVAFLFPSQVFHLFGYKKLFKKNKHFLMARRKFDLKPPDNREVKKEYLKLLALN